VGAASLSPFAAAICGLLILLISIRLRGSGADEFRPGAVAQRGAFVNGVADGDWRGVSGLRDLRKRVRGLSGRAAFALSAAGRSWNWIGSGRLFFGGLDFDSGSGAALAACFGMFAAALAAVIPLERARSVGGWVPPQFPPRSSPAGLSALRALGLGRRLAGGAGELRPGVAQDSALDLWTPAEPERFRWWAACRRYR